jgi:hypothetical protein
MGNPVFEDIPLVEAVVVDVAAPAEFIVLATLVAVVIGVAAPELEATPGCVLALPGLDFLLALGPGLLSPPSLT